MIGLDTGFFIKLLKGDEVAVEAWKNVVEEKEQAAVSALTLFELERFGLKRMIDKETADLLAEAINSMCEVLWISDPELIPQATRLSHGLGLPAISALILASFVHRDINKVYTTDKSFKNYRKKGFETVLLYS